MSESLNFVQKKDANNFSKYALVPYHMLDHIDFIQKTKLGKSKKLLMLALKHVWIVYRK